MGFPYERWDRNILIKRGLPSEQEGRFERPLKTYLEYGIVNLDKPSGPTSHMVSSYLKQILHVSKCGHSGTLDPHVTGVLPIALGKASRIVQALLPAGKEYVGLMHLHSDVPEERLRHTISEFTGEISQLPPVKSAVKRRLRKRTVYYFELLEIEGRDVLFRVGCQAGTYIRKLCYDIGKRLGTNAHMQELRRTRVAEFREEGAFTLYDIKDAYEYYLRGNEKPLKAMILPPEVGVAHLPKIWVQPSAIESLSHGRDLAVPGITKLEACVAAGTLVAVMSPIGELVALGNALMSANEILSFDKGIAVQIHKVFIHHARGS